MSFSNLKSLESLPGDRWDDRSGKPLALSGCAAHGVCSGNGAAFRWAASADGQYLRQSIQWQYFRRRDIPAL